MTRSLDFDVWVDEARKSVCMDVLDRRGHRLKRSGTELTGACPVCGGTDRFSVNLRKNIFHCRKSRAGGDAIALVQYLDGCDFLRAVETLTGRAAPDGREGSGLTAAELAMREAARVEAEARRDKEADSFRRWAWQQGKDIWDTTQPGKGTMVEDYFALRGLGRDVPHYARFAPSLAYVHPVPIEDYEDMRARGLAVQPAKTIKPGDKSVNVVVMTGPAMVAQVTDPDNGFGAAHVTWLDLAKPKGKAEVVLSGELLVSKKVFGLKKGGAIRLFKGSVPTLVIGEGIETTSAVRHALRGCGHELADAHFWAGVDLGNMGGKALGTVPHPTLTRQDSKGRTRILRVPGPEPDLSDTKTFIPPDAFKRIVILGDGDSDRFSTDCTLKRAARRWARPGRVIQIAWADDGEDFNDMVDE